MRERSSTTVRRLGPRTPFHVELPRHDEQAPAQDEEWCWLEIAGDKERVRFHDYADLYAVPGLYEHLFYDKLKCTSPETVRFFLQREVEKAGMDPRNLSVLELGAGNGMVAEELTTMGVKDIVGVDIIEEAAEAAQRDRPGVYSDYYVVDMTNRASAEVRHLFAHGFNCLTTVAALGFGDIPPAAFLTALAAIQVPGWVAFNIKDEFLRNADSSGFAHLIADLLDAGVLREQARYEYRHRLSISGTPLYYTALVATKERAPSAQLEAAYA